MNQSSYVVGIDSGSQNTKAVIMKDGAILKTAIVSTDFDALAAAEKVYASLLEQVGIPEAEVGAIVSTGTSRNLISFATDTVNEIIAAAVGTHYVVPEAHMLLDMGADYSDGLCLHGKGYELRISPLASRSALRISVQSEDAEFARQLALSARDLARALDQPADSGRQ